MIEPPLSQSLCLSHSHLSAMLMRQGMMTAGETAARTKPSMRPTVQGKPITKWERTATAAASTKLEERRISWWSSYELGGISSLSSSLLFTFLEEWGINQIQWVSRTHSVYSPWNEGCSQDHSAQVPQSHGIHFKAGPNENDSQTKSPQLPRYERVQLMSNIFSFATLINVLINVRINVRILQLDVIRLCATSNSDPSSLSRGLQTKGAE